MNFFKKRIGTSNEVISVCYPLVLDTLLDKDVLLVCGFNPYIHNVLNNNGIITMRQLCRLSYDKLTELPGLGSKRVNMIVSELTSMGLSLSIK